MLQSRCAGKLAHGIGIDARNETLSAGWDLLDGQQRLRSLLLGHYGPDLRVGQQDGRCLWINLNGKSSRYLFDIVLTSTSQPFGYNENGYKLSSDDRARARKRFEPNGTLIKSGDRQAYSHELFGGFFLGAPQLSHLVGDQILPVPPDGYPKAWPPLPHGVNCESSGRNRTTLPLHVVLQYWNDAPESREEGLSRLINEKHGRFKDLVAALRCFDNATIGLVNTTSVVGEYLPLLYDRIGAGGVPLSGEDRLFSLYKAYRPDFHDVVRAIYDNTGRAMAPSQIAASAIRVANALAHALSDPEQPSKGNGLPDITKFAQNANLLNSLDKLTGFSGRGSQTGGPFSENFIALFRALTHEKNSNPLGFPKVLLGQMDPNLLNVLLFWMLYTGQRVDKADNHLPRFVMFWILCTLNRDKASLLCFELIRRNKGISLKAIWSEVTKISSLSMPLLCPVQMSTILVDKSGRGWRIIGDRTKDLKWPNAEFVKRWWKDTANVLPWLQRAYLAEAFPGYDPTADREDDTPYDIDHMVPRADWGFDWGARHVRMPFPEDKQSALRWVRFDIGDSIGNKWLVDFSTNRGWGDEPVTYKLNEMGEAATANEKPIRLLLDVFDEASEEIWRETSPPECRLPTWTDQRMVKFQRAVEERAAWLYARLYSDLTLSDWADHSNMNT
jgi:hypothetical protein